MFKFSNLKVVLATAPLLLLLSCGMGDKADWPSLSADEQWDRMREERDKTYPQADMSDEGDSSEALPPANPIHSVLNREESKQILIVAPEKYQTLSQKINRGLEELAEASQDKMEQKRRWRTVQLYISRLTALRNEIAQAIESLARENSTAGGSLAAEEEEALEAGRQLIIQINNRLEDSLTRLAKATP